MPSLLLATNNKDKIVELQDLLKDLHLQPSRQRTFTSNSMLSKTDSPTPRTRRRKPSPSPKPAD
ncbi:MAG: hypothetical protein U0V48_00310 [Anaerolineales bacterium]